MAYLYDAGELGTRKRWERALGAPGRPASSFFDKDGHLRPYEQLDIDHKIPLLVWIRTGPYSEQTYDARLRAAARVRPDC